MASFGLLLSPEELVVLSRRAADAAATLERQLGLQPTPILLCEVKTLEIGIAGCWGEFLELQSVNIGRDKGEKGEEKGGEGAEHHGSSSESDGCVARAACHLLSGTSFVTWWSVRILLHLHHHDQSRDSTLSGSQCRASCQACRYP